VTGLNFRLLVTVCPPIGGYGVRLIRLCEWGNWIAVMPKVDGSTLYMVGSVLRSIVETTAPNVLVTGSHCWRSSWVCEWGKQCGVV